MYAVNLYFPFLKGGKLPYVGGLSLSLCVASPKLLCGGAVGDAAIKASALPDVLFPGDAGRAPIPCRHSCCNRSVEAVGTLVALLWTPLLKYARLWTPWALANCDELLTWHSRVNRQTIKQRSTEATNQFFIPPSSQSINESSEQSTIQEPWVNPFITSSWITMT